MKLFKTILRVLGLLLLVAVTYFFFYAGVREDKRRNVAEKPNLSKVTPEVMKFHHGLIIADLHSDNLLWDRDPLKRLDHDHADIPRLIEGNFSIQVFDAVIKVPMGQNYFETKEPWDQITFLAMMNRWPVSAWFSLAERAMYQSEILHRAAAKSEGRLRIVRSSGQLRNFLADRKADQNMVGGVLSIEGLHALEGDIGNLKRFYDAGYRIMGRCISLITSWVVLRVVSIKVGLQILEGKL